MKFYKMGSGGEEILYPEPDIFEESPWYEEDFFMNRCEHKYAGSPHLKYFQNE